MKKKKIMENWEIEGRIIEIIQIFGANLTMPKYTLGTKLNNCEDVFSLEREAIDLVLELSKRIPHFNWISKEVK